MSDLDNFASGRRLPTEHGGSRARDSHAARLPRERSRLAAYEQLVTSSEVALANHLKRGRTPWVHFTHDGHDVDARARALVDAVATALADRVSIDLKTRSEVPSFALSQASAAPAIVCAGCGKRLILTQLELLAWIVEALDTPKPLPRYVARVR